LKVLPVKLHPTWSRIDPKRTDRAARTHFARQFRDLARCDRIATTIEFHVYLPTSGFFSGPYPAILVELGGLLMRRLSATFIAAVSTVAFAQIAAAADLPRKAPIYTPPPVYSWTGFYIGANIGGGWGGRSVNYAPNDPEADALFRFGGAPPRASFTSSA